MTRVLLIEDSATQAAKFRALLEGAGYRVDLAESGEAGLRRFEASPYDLVLSDILMPGINGYEVCRRIKAMGRTPAVPVVLLTMLEDPRDIIRALQSGADNYITKAHADERLIPQLQDLLAARARREQTPGDSLSVRFMDEDYAIEGNTEQILDLLVTTFEDNVRARAELEASNQKLEHQNVALRRAETLKQELSALVVHDLKSPTSGLLMLAQMQLRKTDIKESDRARWRMVFSTAEMLQRMILNLLDISRSEDGALSLHTEPVPVMGLVHDVQEILQFQMEERRQELAVTVDDDARLVRVDRELVRRVLLNLLDNACRHAPVRGRIEVLAGIRRPGWVRISVANSGATIAPEYRERVFEKYVRLDREAADRIEPGRGLGLPFCRTAVEAHGGRIWVSERDEGGTAFCFEVPLDHESRQD